MTLVSVNLKPVLSGMTTLLSAKTLMDTADASSKNKNFFIKYS
jgi:hypothetical protein